jgi:hypothetical protein
MNIVTEENTVVTITEEKQYNHPALFTRYLYIKQDVFWTLVMSIVTNHIDEALFWGYELYYSGFRKELLDFLQFICDEFYQKKNHSKMKRFVSQKITQCRIHRDKSYLLAIVIANMANRQCDLYDFMMKHEFHSEDETVEYILEKDAPRVYKRQIYIMYNDNDITKYKTISVNSGLRSNHVLKSVCEYRTDKDSSALRNVIKCPTLEKYITPLYPREEMIDMWKTNWQYYCYFTPIWRSRFDMYKGKIDDETKKIIFIGDSMQELFYTSYGYEPDEQYAELIECIVGSV